MAESAGARQARSRGTATRRRRCAAAPWRRYT